jgi:hypothetical protein
MRPNRGLYILAAAAALAIFALMTAWGGISDTMEPDQYEHIEETAAPVVHTAEPPQYTIQPGDIPLTGYDVTYDAYCDEQRHLHEIAKIVEAWEHLDEEQRQAARDYILETGIAYMDEPTARMLGVWDGYPEPHYDFTEDDIDMIVRTVWGEARGCTPDEWRLVVWTILQRVDDPRWPNTIAGVVTQHRQFIGYRSSFPVQDDIRAVVLEELTDWTHGAPPPVIYPFATSAPYFFFDGDGRHNWFREEWRP